MLEDIMIAGVLIILFKARRGITHRGSFHADDVFAAALCELLYEKFHDNNGKFNILRVNNMKDVEDYDDENDIVFDIGGGKYDHHQLTFNKARNNGIKYSSFGLLWKDYGILLCENNYDIWKKLDDSLVTAIDARDNGQDLILDKNQIIAFPITVSQIIGDMNLSWDWEGEDYNKAQDDKFKEAVLFAKEVLTNRIESMLSAYRAREFVQSAIEKSVFGIIVLEKFAPWQEVVCASEKAKNCLYIVYPSNREGFCVQAIPRRKGSYELRKPLPAGWWGLEKKMLQAASGVMDAIFCHKSGFLCVAETFNGAMKLAELAIRY